MSNNNNNNNKHIIDIIQEHFPSLTTLCSDSLCSALKRYPLDIVKYCQLKSQRQQRGPQGREHHLLLQVLEDVDGWTQYLGTEWTPERVARLTELCFNNNNNNNNLLEEEEEAVIPPYAQRQGSDYNMTNNNNSIILPESFLPDPTVFAARREAVAVAARQKKSKSTASKRSRRDSVEGDLEDGGSGEDVVVCVMDQRERLPLFTEHCQKNPTLFRIMTLPIGDFVLCKAPSAAAAVVDDDAHRLRLLGVVIERKTVTDLSSSIIDGRFYDQRARLWASGVPLVVYVIEGSLKATFSLPIEALNSAIYSLSLREGYRVVLTPNPAGTLSFVQMLMASSNSSSTTGRLDLAIRRYQQRHQNENGGVFPHRLCIQRIDPNGHRHGGDANIRTRDLIPNDGDGESLATWMTRAREAATDSVREDTFFRLLCRIPGVGPETAVRLHATFPSMIHLRNYFVEFEENKQQKEGIETEFALALLTWNEEQHEVINSDGTRPKKKKYAGAATSARKKLVTENISSTIYKMLCK
eukprot:PhM_4_TR11904/c0_g1_i1/m.27169